MPRVLLIRHCASTAQHPEAPLTDAGRAASHGLALQLQALGIDAVYSSPYARAVATIAPFADRFGLALNVEERLRERQLAREPLGDFLEHIRRSFEDPDYRVGGGESLRETGDRGLAALGEIALKGYGLPVAVSHGNLISAVLRSVNESFGFEHWRALRNPDLFTLEFAEGHLVSYTVSNALP